MGPGPYEDAGGHGRCCERDSVPPIPPEPVVSVLCQTHRGHSRAPAWVGQPGTRVTAAVPLPGGRGAPRQHYCFSVFRVEEKNAYFYEALFYQDLFKGKRIPF